MEYTCKFKQEVESSGDYQSFIFEIYKGEEKIENWLEIRISGTFCRGFSQVELIKIAASAVREHLQRNIPEGCHLEGNKRVIMISTYWFPGKPNTPKFEENYENFSVQIPRKTLGFNLN